MITVTEIQRIGEIFPAAWEGKASDGGQVYIRFRHGWLSVYHNPAGGVEFIDQSECIFESQPYGNKQPEMEDEEMRRLTASVLHFPA